MPRHKKSPLLSRKAFIKKILWSMLFGSITVANMIVIGMIGFHFIEGVSWIDAFLQSSMFFGGMGSEFIIETWWGKLFGAFFAILCPFALVAAITILLLPLLHRFLHKFHIGLGKMGIE